MPTGSQEMLVKLWSIWSNLTVNINKDERAQCKSHANLGVPYSSLGQFQEALYHHEQQLRCVQIVGDSQEGLDALNQMATCVMKLGNPAQAAVFYKDAYKMARQLADRNVVFQQLLKVADAFELANDLDNTLLWYRKHLTLAKEKRDKSKKLWLMPTLVNSTIPEETMNKP